MLSKSMKWPAQSEPSLSGSSVMLLLAMTTRQNGLGRSL